MFKKGLLLIEINSEELPIDKLKYINVYFNKYLKYQLKKYNFYFKKIKVFVTLRRISCLIKKLSFNQNFNNTYKIIYGPKINIKKKDILKNKILINWSKKIGLSIKKIKYFNKNNFKNFFFKININIYNIKKLIFIILNKTIINLLKNNKIMTWGNGKYFFFRPVRNIIIMFNNKKINLNIFGIKSSNFILGHKFINNKKIFLNSSKKYIFYLLKYGKVIIDYKYRRKKILNILNNFSLKKNIKFIYKNNYLNKIVSMIEWPLGILCNFNKKFLFLPEKIIIFIIKKYFGFISFNEKNDLKNYFVIIIDNKIYNFNKIKDGYENVINSELNEIKNFFIKDRKFYLISYLYKLKNIIFHKKVGNYLNKITRMLFLSKNILFYLNYLNIDLNILYYSILLIKCDLVTNLYKYYNNLKGIIGMYYSLLDGESLNISLIIKNHYSIKNNNNIYSLLIFLIDKIDDLISIFILYDFKFLEKKNDPYGLRKISFLIIKVILNNKFYINFYKIIKYSIFLFNNKNIIKKKNILIILNYINKRFINYLIKLKYSKKIIFGIYYKINNFDILDIKNRIDIIIKFKNIIYFKKFIYIYKRLNNLLIKFNKFININIFYINLLKKKEEIILYKYICILKKKIKIFYLNHNYNNLIKYFFISIKKINNFLNFIKIDVKNINLKLNRLNLLNKIFILFKNFYNFNIYF